MPFKEVKRVIYKNNPIVQVVCQLRFPRILSINERAPVDFQDFIRKDYPNYNVAIEQQQQFMLETGIESPPKVIQNEKINNYMFSSVEEHWQINLTSTFLSLTSSNYKRWEDFYSRLQVPLNALKKVYKPAFFERIGLRYINAYRRSALKIDTKTYWTELISPFALGFLSNKDISEEITGYSATSDIDLGNDAMARIITSTGFVGDILFQKNPELSFIVDSDLYFKSKKEINDLDKSLESLHEYSGRLIRNIITEKLHQAMEPEEI